MYENIFGAQNDSKLQITFQQTETNIYTEGKSASVHEIISWKHIQNDINYKLPVSREWFTWFRQLLITSVEILSHF